MPSGPEVVARDLTARRAVEEQLRQAEQRFHQLVDAVIDYAIFMLDPDGYVATWNVGASRVKGYSADEIIGKHFSVFYTADDRAAGRPEEILEAVRREGRFEDQSWRVRKDGSRFWANVVITVLRDETGNLVGFAKVTRDLTARREKEEAERRLVKEQAAREAAEQAEQRLRESEERYRALSQRLEIVFEGVADGITVQERSGRVVFANTAAARICGFQTGEELVNTPPAEVLARYEILDLDGRPFDVEHLPARRVFAGHEGRSAVLHIRELATHRDWWVLLRASAVLGSDGKPEFAINIWHDVTFERRQERHALHLAEATASLGHSLRMEEMLSTLAAQLVPWLGDWCSIYVLDGERLTDVAVAHADREKEDVANEYRRRFPPDPAHAGGVWGVIRSGSAEVFNGITDEALTRSTVDPEALRLLRSIGMRAALIAPIRVRDRVLGAIALVSARHERQYDAADVQLLEEVGRRAGVALENAQLYKSAQEAARQAEEASRAKDEFLATVSHELRTPLSAIVGWSSILKDRVTDPALAKPIEVIHRNAKAQVKIIEDILDVSRVIAGSFRIDAKATDVVAITREAIEIVRPAAAAKKLSIDFTPSADFCLMIADPERLQQIVWNLLSNAVKFTDEGTIEVRVGRDGSKIVISVRDTGKGIDPAFLPHVFERFRQADSTITRRVGGLGLGLALVRHMVELHGGQVIAESEGLGKGSTFMITLPVGAVVPAPLDSPSAPRAKPSTTDELSLQGVSVLLVDDEADARDMLAEVLQDSGAVVQTARSAAEGYERFCLAPPDVLISDVGMPEEDGYSFIQRIRALPASGGGRVPALALTAFTRREDRLSALAAGYTTHVSKPVDAEVLVAAIASSLDRRRS